MTYQEGEHLIIVHGTITSDAGPELMPDGSEYHYIKAGTLVRVILVRGPEPHWGPNDHRTTFGERYQVEPAEDGPEAWVDGDMMGSQEVFDIHVELAPRPDLSSIESVDAFLEGP